MAEGIRLYAGTQDGLLVWRTRNGNWDQVCHEFQGGVIDGIAACRAQPERVYVISAGDGVYRTDDAGTHWGRVFDGEVRALSIDQSDDSIV